MPRLKNPRQEAVAQAKVAAYLDPANAPSDVQIVKKIYDYSQESAEKHACAVVGSCGVQKRIMELLPDEAIARKSKQLFNWKDPIHNKLGQVIAKAPNGEVQYKTWMAMLKIKGVLSDGISLNSPNVFTLNVSTVNILEPILSRLDKVSERLQLIDT